MNGNGLSDTPSVLLREAMDDLRLMEKAPGYKIDMDYWNQPLGDGKCRVCLAGATMVRRVNPTACSPMLLGLRDAQKMRALNNFRVGWIGNALSYLGINIAATGLPLSIPVVEYRYDRAGFFRDMAYIVALLEDAGL